MTVDILYNQSCGLGEGPFWHPVERVLYWLDIKTHQIHCLDPKTKVHRQWQMPGLVGSAIPCKTGGFIAGYRDSIAHIDLHTTQITLLAETHTGLRMNDGLCDAQGRFWVGSCDDECKAQACLYRYTPSGEFTVMQRNLTISNGLDWSLDQQTFYLSDSPTRTIYAFDFNSETGDIFNRREFIRVPEAKGVPDGLTVDSAGYLWVAHWGGSCVTRYSPQGERVQEISVPAKHVTSCMFGGDDYKTLFITSAASNVHEDSVLPAPNGFLFAVQLPVAGRPQNLFGQ